MAKKFKQIIFIVVVLLIGISLLLFMIARQKTPTNKQQTAQSSLKVEADSKEKDINDMASKNPATSKRDSKSDNITQKSKQDELIANHIAAFEDAFYSGDMEKLNKLASNLLDSGGGSLPKLLKFVSDQSKPTLLRKMIFEIIRDIGLSEKDAPIFLQIASNYEEDPIIRGEAVWALGLTRSQDVIEPLIEFLGDNNENSRVRKLAATSLGLLNAKQAEPTLTDVLYNKNNDNKIRAAAVEAFGLINNNLNLKILTEFLNDQSWQVQIETAKSLSKIGGDQAAKALNNKLISCIQKEKSDINNAVIKALIKSISKIKNPESVPILINILKGDDVLFSSYAGQALGEIGDKKALPVIKEVLNNASDRFQNRLLKEAYSKLTEQ